MKTPIGLPKKRACDSIADRLKTAAPLYEMGDPREKYVQEEEMERRDRDRGTGESDFRRDYMQHTDFRGAASKLQNIVDILSVLYNEGVEPFMGLDPGEDWQAWYDALESAIQALHNMERAR